MKIKKLIKLFSLDKFLIKTLTFLLNETVRENPQALLSIQNEIDSFKKKLFENKKRQFESTIKKFGPNSYFAGTTHTITGVENLEIGENVHIEDNCVIRAEGGISIGDNTHISKNLLLYSINHNYEGLSLPHDETYIKKPVKIGNNVWIGMNVCIAPGTIIGDGAIIGMGTTVSGIVPPLSIIGSQKWRIIGSRNEEHYSALDTLGRYAGINGMLYVNNDKTLHEVGERKNSRRSILEVIDFRGKKAIKKQFLETEDGLVSFENEKLACEKFNQFIWYPKVYETGPDYVIYEYLDNDTRIDKAISLWDEKEKQEILKQIILVLLDLFSNGYAHRDFHCRNLFYSKQHGVKLLDYETIVNIENEATDFFNSYDVTGAGLESPYLTGNMCVMGDYEISISKMFDIKDLNCFIKIVESVLIEQLYEISSSFYTKRYHDKDRHFLRNKYIYNTFDLPYLKVDWKIGQRNIVKRLQNFGINETQIKGKKILDIGSNVGGMLFEINKMGPSKALGIEYDKDKVDISNIISKIHNFNKITFLQKDVESEDFNNSFNDVFDVVFCLAVVEHLKNKERFIHKLSKICGKYLFIEGNSGTDIEWLTSELKTAGFSVVRYLGLSDDEKDEYNNNRPLFICEK